MTRNRTFPARAMAALVLFAAALTSCDDNPAAPIPGETPAPKPGITPLGVIEVTVTGLGTDQISASATGLSMDLRPPQNSGGTANGSIQLESVRSGSFSEGTRGLDGQRYVYTTFRVRNAQSNGTAYDTPRHNLTFLAVNTASSIPGTPVAVLRRFDGSTASSAIAPQVVPTGSVSLGDSLVMRALRPDVLQAFDEGELPSGAALPAGINDVYPYGFVVTNPTTPGSRDLAASPAPNQFDGLVTFAFRIPLQASDPSTTNGPTKDVFTMSLHFLAVDDGTTRVTESIEEQTPAGHVATAARAAAIGATQVTVLNGSPAGATLSAYPGQRQLCSVRTAGSGGSATRINAPGAYTRLAFYTVGETRDACAPLFRTGAPARPAVGVDFPVQVYAMDRYGNTLTSVTDTAVLRSKPGSPPVTYSPVAALVNGAVTLSANYANYGTDTLYAIGRRVRGTLPVLVAGVTRVWEGDVSSDWNDGGNWNIGARPYPLDSVQVPVVASGVYPILSQNEAINGVEVGDGATLNIGAFNLTAGSSVLSALTTGGIIGTSGRVVLAGTGQLVAGRLPRLRVTGSYSLAGNVQTTATLQVAAGRLRSQSFRIRVIP